MNYTYNHMNVETAISNEPITPSAAFPSCQAHDPDHRWRAMVTFRFNAVFFATEQCGKNLGTCEENLGRCQKMWENLGKTWKI